MPDDSIKKTVGVALGVCLVCSVLVSTAAVTLNAIQEENKKLDKIKNILLAGGLLSDGMEDIKAAYDEKVEPTLIELATGAIVSEENYDKVLNIEHFDLKAICSHSDYSDAISPKKDIANIKRRPRYMLVYSVKENGQTDKVILPVFGKGLWSTLFGFVALNKDMKTVAGFTFYEHGETPGLGGEIDNPRWKKMWLGKAAFNDAGEVVIEVLKGKVDNAGANANHQIDGLSGATLTTRGVDQLVKYWLSSDGYGPFLNKLRQEG